MKSLILKGSLLLLLLATCLSCQKSGWILDGTWVRVCEVSSPEMERGEKYEYLVFERDGKVNNWFETAEGVRTSQFTLSYTLSDNVIHFTGHTLTIRENALLGSSGSHSSVVFYRQ